ncbi:hypothetical protein FOA52_009768 [Chlamydomonas sp. UWO 241]|nr:hypothetical protein FOA52_009768 [Chlamydomonas sp. UWO 241]
MRKHRIHSSDFSNREEFLQSDSLADYVGLERVDAIHMPVPLNFVFLGFDGDGHLDVTYTTAQLQGWFGHLDHVLPHARIELSELSCAEDGYCAGLVHGSYRPKALHSYVHLNFTCQVVAIKRRSVIATFERAIHIFSRPVVLTVHGEATGAAQVDATKFEAFVDHFVASLGLEFQYTQIVINPVWSPMVPNYGYRVGLSASEIDHIGKAGKEQLMRLLADLRDDEPALPPPIQKGMWRDSRWTIFVAQSADAKFSVNDLTGASEEWVQLIDPYLKREDDHRNRQLKASLEPTGTAAVVQAARVLKRLTGPLTSALREELFGQPEKLLSKFRTMHPAEDCVVGNWVGRKRWMLLDLTAGTSDWGPATGGEGVVTKNTIPRVDDYFGSLARDQRVERAKGRVEGDQEMTLHEELKAERSATMASTSNSEYQGFMLQKQAWEAAAAAPGAPPVDTQRAMELWGAKYREALARAELDTYERFALRHCNKQVNPVTLCADIKQDVAGLRAKLSKIAAAGVLTTELFPKHNWDIFGLGAGAWAGDSRANEKGRVQHDYFMAELASLLSRGLRHVIAPPSGVWRSEGRGFVPPLSPSPSKGQGGGGRVRPTAQTYGSRSVAGPFSKLVTFEIYHVWENKHAVDTGGGLGNHFDVDAFQQQVMTLRLAAKTGAAHQRFEFKMRHLNIADDPSLAAAFAVSLRSSSHEVVSTEEGTEEPEGVTESLSIDSRELVHHLRNGMLAKATPPSARASERTASSASFAQGILPSLLAAAGSSDSGLGISTYAARAAANEMERNRARAEAEKEGEGMTIPVVILQLNRKQAILIDEHYNGRAVDDVVLVVMNAAREDEHPTGMMCNGALQSRPLSPLRDALAAVLQALGGVLPPHIGYNPGRKQVTHDWLWSVGAHALSVTSMGVEYSDMQRDAVGRSYLLDALDLSVETVNRGVALLAAQRPTHALHRHIMNSQATFKTMIKHHSATLEAWKAVVTLSLTLDYGKAAEQIRTLRFNSELFYSHAERLSTTNEHLHCLGRASLSSDEGSPLIRPLLYTSAALALGAAVYAVSPLVMGAVFKRPGNQRRLI